MESFINMEDNRLTKIIFRRDTHICKNNWSSDFYKVLQEINLQSSFNDETPVNVKSASTVLQNIMKEKWSIDVNNTPKLRTYRTYKSVYETEPYVSRMMSRSCRSFMAQFRCGILPLKVETGPYQNIPVEFRLCIFCNDNVCESEVHFLLHCNLYNDLREELFVHVVRINPIFHRLSEFDKIGSLMSKDIVKSTAQFIQKAIMKRRQVLYN